MIVTYYKSYRETNWELKSGEGGLVSEGVNPRRILKGFVERFTE